LSRGSILLFLATLVNVKSMNPKSKS
jgi:hypothetical protein